jgi:hypothetical protein
MSIAIPSMVLIITMIVFSAANATIHPWLYVSLHILLQSEEFVFVFIMIQIISRKPFFGLLEKTPENSGSDVKSEVETVNNCTIPNSSV